MITAAILRSLAISRFHVLHKALRTIQPTCKGQQISKIKIPLYSQRTINFRIKIKNAIVLCNYN